MVWSTSGLNILNMGAAEASAGCGAALATGLCARPPDVLRVIAIWFRMVLDASKILVASTSRSVYVFVRKSCCDNHTLRGSEAFFCQTDDLGNDCFGHS